MLTCYIKLSYVYVKFQVAIEAAHLQKPANRSILNGTLVIEMANIVLVNARKKLIA